MAANLLSETWKGFDSHELRLLLDKHIGGPGQYDGRPENPDRLYLPLAESACQVVLTFRDTEIVAIESGPAFDPAEWEQIGAAIETSILAGPSTVGREYSFSSFRVRGSWQGERSRVQILPPPEHAPQAEYEMAEHPFILEFSIKGSDFWPLTNHRRMREHRKLTLLLNILLTGHTSFQLRRPGHFWAAVPRDDGGHDFHWLQQFYCAKLGKAVLDEFSPPAIEQLDAVEPDAYYAEVGGHDGRGLHVPADLGLSICNYRALSPENRAAFDRAAFWFDMASRQWNISVSASFAALVSAIESLTGRGDLHRFNCPGCGNDMQHENPGATRRFRDFLETHVPGATLAKRRNSMYSLRSGILHGGKLMQLDQDLAFGWDPPGWNERELHTELWGLTRLSLRHWLQTRPETGCTDEQRTYPDNGSPQEVTPHRRD